MDTMAWGRYCLYWPLDRFKIMLKFLLRRTNEVNEKDTFQ